MWFVIIGSTINGCFDIIYESIVLENGLCFVDYKMGCMLFIDFILLMVCS